MQSTTSHLSDKSPTESGLSGVANPTSHAASLLESPLVVVNIGLEGFATELAAQQVDVTSVDWQPPAGGNAELARLLALLDS